MLRPSRTMSPILQTQWRVRVGTVRRGSAVDLLIHALPGVSIVTVHGATDLMGRSFQATNEAISLTDAGILKQVNVGRRNRAFEASELIRRFTALERRLDSPAANTDHRNHRDACRDARNHAVFG